MILYLFRQQIRRLQKRTILKLHAHFEIDFFYESPPPFPRRGGVVLVGEQKPNQIEEGLGLSEFTPDRELGRLAVETGQVPSQSMQ